MLVLLAALAFPSQSFARNLPAPDQISYDGVPSYAANGGTEILEWAQKSAAAPNEPLVPSSLTAPAGLRLRWLGTAGFEISDDETTILLDPFVSRPGYIDVLLFQKLPIDTEAVDKYVLDPLGPNGLSKVKAVLVSHTHHDHAQDAPYILAKFPHAADRPMIVGDPNMRQLLKLYKGRVKENPWLEGVDDLDQGPQKIVEFGKREINDPPIDKPLGHFVGQFGDFKVTAYVNWHGLYDTYPVELKGPMRGKPPFIALDYLAYLHTSLMYLIEWKGFRILATDSARGLNGDRTGYEIVSEGGPIDLLLQGIASRLKDNHIAERVDWTMPRYFIPTHYDNFFFPMDQFWKFDYKILLPNDNSLFKEFIDDYCGKEVNPPCPALRTMKMFYYYSLSNLLTR
jgi:L-ascorbate metabolism protein UlaG (beta-lactamase superfamily)